MVLKWFYPSGPGKYVGVCEFVDGRGSRCHVVAFAAGNWSNSEQSSKKIVTLGRWLVGVGLGGGLLLVVGLALLELEVGG